MIGWPGLTPYTTGPLMRGFALSGGVRMPSCGVCILTSFGGYFPSANSKTVPNAHPAIMPSAPDTSRTTDSRPVRSTVASSFTPFLTPAFSHMTFPSGATMRNVAGSSTSLRQSTPLTALSETAPPPSGIVTRLGVLTQSEAQYFFPARHTSPRRVPLGPASLLISIIGISYLMPAKAVVNVASVASIDNISFQFPTCNIGYW